MMIPTPLGGDLRQLPIATFSKPFTDTDKQMLEVCQCGIIYENQLKPSELYASSFPNQL